MKHRQGFTVIEVIIVLALVITGSVLFFMERAQVMAASRDTDRKVAINAMYYNLEEVYYSANQNYPQTIDSKTLRAMDPELFKDPSGLTFGEAGTTYQYEGINCTAEGACKQYRLSADLEREDDYVKTSRRGN